MSKAGPTLVMAGLSVFVILFPRRLFASWSAKGSSLDLDCYQVEDGIGLDHRAGACDGGKRSEENRNPSKTPPMYVLR
jgi:hypothetical protein